MQGLQHAGRLEDPVGTQADHRWAAHLPQPHAVAPAAHAGRLGREGAHCRVGGVGVVVDDRGDAPLSAGHARVQVDDAAAVLGHEVTGAAGIHVVLIGRELALALDLQGVVVPVREPVEAEGARPVIAGARLDRRQRDVHPPPPGRRVHAGVADHHDREALLPALLVGLEVDEAGLVLLDQLLHVREGDAVVPVPVLRGLAGVIDHHGGEHALAVEHIRLEVDQPSVLLVDLIGDLAGRQAVVPVPAAGVGPGVAHERSGQLRRPGAFDLEVDDAVAGALA
jgi:hypothetical protein